MIAWTGGSKPRPLSSIDHHERALLRYSFRFEMLRTLAFWGDYKGCTGSTLQMARIVWRRARYIAHATAREAEHRDCID